MIVIGFRLQKMKLILTHFRVLFAAIILIAASAMVSSVPDLACKVWDVAVEFGVASDMKVSLANHSDLVTSLAAATTPDNYHSGCGQDCTNCMSSIGSSCCGAAAVPLTSGREGLDPISIAAYGWDGGLLGTGINPETLMRPPRFFA